MKYFFLSLLVTFLAACSTSKKIAKPVLLNQQTFLLTEISTDPSYGFSKDNPISVGGVKESQGPLNERRYLNALAGPNGETVDYERETSCCPIKSENGFLGMAMLDIYRVTWEGSKDTLSIYINMYDHDKLKAPKGFSIKK
ncbi:hypothetical protein [Aureibacter tunicatorum]|uniref:2-dehydro-3-deoxyphosphooctonate aldolase n=1 Tax=Aureibacter tunicatorum TaxID=866807 RepID=A0AAE4BV02_9BACT|nr:hypothetical protein [Aureibacter tunicatorum]MDR6241362.1 hypothetical protein [Aureibacter tunicatorum]BDD06793.1 hypothetical protein AUTU_42760 [Aureibacter tunicatorum]